MADFGITCEATSNTLRPTKNGKGTPGYRAPEILGEDDDRSFNNKVDIWAMGCILYELAVGKKAFAGDNATREYKWSEPITVTLDEHYSDRCKQNITKSIVSMLKVDPTLRPSAQKLSDEFRAMLGDQAHGTNYTTRAPVIVENSAQDLTVDIQEHRDAIQKEPTNYWLWNSFCMQVGMSNFDEAIEVCEQAIEKHPDNPSPAMALSQLYAAQGNFESAITGGMKLTRLNMGLMKLALSEPKHTTLPKAAQVFPSEGETTGKSWISANTGYKRESLHMAAWTGDVEQLEMLWRRGHKMTRADADGWTALHLATWNMHINAVSFLIEMSDSQWLSVADNRFRYTALHLATWNNDSEIIRKLSAAGANVSAQATDGSTAIIMAARNGYVEALNALIEAGASVSAKGYEEWTPLHFAAGNGHVNIINVLKSEANVKTSEGWTPMHLAAGNGHDKAVLALKDAGAKIMPKDSKGWTPMHCAANSGHVNTINILKNAGASVFSVTESGSTPMHWAAANGHPAAIRTLKNLGAATDAVTKLKSTPMHLAARFGQVEAIKILKEVGGGGCVSAQNKNGLTPMHIAAENGHVNVIKTLRDIGGGVSARNKHGITPLHLAAAKGRVNTIKALIDAGADVSAESREGTPLQKARQNKHLDAVKVLMDAGGDVKPPTKWWSGLFRSSSP